MRSTYGTATCIAVGTRISAPWGQIPIEVIDVLDEIHGYDPDTHARTVARVTTVRRAERECVCLHLACGGSLRLTSDHPVWSPETRRFEAAGRWVTGHLQLLSCHVGDKPGVTVVTGREYFVGVLPVYDLVLAAPHQCFLADNILVHS